MLPGKTYTIDEVAHLAWRRKWLILVPFVVMRRGYRRGLAFSAEQVPVGHADSRRAAARARELRAVDGDDANRGSAAVDQPADPEPHAARADHLGHQPVCRGARARSIMEDIVEQMRSATSTSRSSRAMRSASATSASDPRTVMTRHRAARVAVHRREPATSARMLAEGTNQFLQSAARERARAGWPNTRTKLEEYRKQHSGELPSQAESNLQVIQNTADADSVAACESLNRDREQPDRGSRACWPISTARRDSQTLGSTQPGSRGRRRSACRRRQLADRAGAGCCGAGSELKPATSGRRAYKRRQSPSCEKRVEAEALAGPMSPARSTRGAMTPMQAQAASDSDCSSSSTASTGRSPRQAGAEESRLRRMVGDVSGASGNGAGA